MASIVVEVQVEAPAETASRVLVEFTNALEARGYSLRLADLAAMQTGEGRVGVEVTTEDADKAAEAVRELIGEVTDAEDVLSLTGSSERLDA